MRVSRDFSHVRTAQGGNTMGKDAQYPQVHKTLQYSNVQAYTRTTPHDRTSVWVHTSRYNCTLVQDAPRHVDTRPSGVQPCTLMHAQLPNVHTCQRHAPTQVPTFGFRWTATTGRWYEAKAAFTLPSGGRKESYTTFSLLPTTQTYFAE